MKTSKLILFLTLIVINGTLFSQTVIVTDVPAYTTGQASSVLDVNSTTKGFLVPRMVETERTAISSPATGLLVYQTDNTSGFYYYDGATWVMLPAGTLSDYLPLAGGTMTGEINTVASTTSTVGLNLPHGAAPTTPVNGDVWTTTAGLFVQINGTTIGPLIGASNIFVQGGNSFGTTAYLGTRDNNDLAIKTNNSELMRIAASGSVGIGDSTFNVTNPEKLKVDAGTSATDDFQSVFVGFGNTNSFAQINIQNKNAGDNASSDLVATANNGTDTSYYVDMGINSSTFNLQSFDVSGPNDGYLYVVGKADGSASGGNMILGTANANKALKFFTGGSRGTNERMRINGVGQVKISDLGNIITNDASSLLELESNTKGILIPHVAINNLALPAPLTAPSEGMLVYGFGGSVPNGFYYWTGSTWSLLGGSITLPLPVGSGGTGLTSLGGTNTLLYTSSANTITSVPTSSADGQFLHTTTAGSIPTWQTVLGIANGGTGSSTQNFVDLTTSQTVAGTKTWSAAATFQTGITSTGGAVDLNASSNFPTNINTGTSTGNVAIGNTAGANTTTINAGTGGMIMNTAPATNITSTLGTTGSAVFASSTAGSDQIAILPQSTGVGAAHTGTITSADLTAARTWTLPDVSGTLLTSGSLTGWALGGNAPAGASIIGTTDNSAVTFQTGTGALNLGTDAAAKAITLGNATGATSATITSGTGGIHLNTGTATDATTTLGTTGSAVFGSSTVNSDKIAILPQSTTNTNTFTGTITSADLTAARTWTFPDVSGTLLTSGSLTGWALGGNAPAGASIIGTTDNSAVTFQTGTGALNLGTDAAAKTITLGNATGATAANITSGTGGINLTTGTATNQTTTLGTTGSAVFASSTANSDKIAILPQSTTNTNTFTGIITSADLTATRTWTLPDVSGTLLTSGSLTGWALGGNAPAGASIIGTTDNSAVTFQTGTGALNLGTDAAAKAITIGNVTGATSLTENVGTGNYTLNGVGGSTYTIGAATTTGTITIGGTAQTGAIGIGTGTGAQILNFGTGAGIKTMNFGTGAVANVITIGSNTGAASTTLNSGTGGLSFITGTATNATITLGTSGAAIFGSSTANSDKIAILPQSTTNTNPFTATITSSDLTAARTWTFPDASGTVVLTTGSGAGWLVGGNAPGASSILGTTDNSAVSLQTGTGALNLGTDAFAKNITIGNVTGATSLTLNTGTGNFILNGVGATSYTVGAATTTGAISIGGTTQTGDITLGSSNTANNIFIANGTGTPTLNLANVTSGGVINMGAGMTTGTITIGGTGVQTGTITIGPGTGAQTLNFATGAGAKTVNIGSLTGASSLTLKAGTGKINIPDAVMLDMSAINNSSTTEGLKLPQSNDNTAATAEGQIGWDADDDVLTVGTGTVAKNIGIPNGMVAFAASNAAWAHPVGVKRVWVKVWGGGGGGGNAGSNASRGGGGGGAYSEGIVDVSNAATHAIVVGAGGAAGSNGGASSFTGVTVVSAGGGTGTTTNAGGAGGTVSGAGSIQIAGGSGAFGRNADGSSGGAGGGSPFGGAGGGGGSGSNTSNNNVNGTAGTFPGGGGGGGSEVTGTGGAGAGGYVIVYW